MIITLFLIFYCKKKAAVCFSVQLIAWNEVGHKVPIFNVDPSFTSRSVILDYRSEGPKLEGNQMITEAACLTVFLEKK